MRAYKSKADALAEGLAVRFRLLDATRRRIEGLGSKGALPRRAIELVYEGLFLSAVTSFESFLEELFLELLVTKGSNVSASRAKAKPRIVVRSASVARELAVGPSRKYVDWLPYDKTVERAKIFFTGGRPFTAAPDSALIVLKKGATIRNVIAHKSRHSVRKFENEVLNHAPLTPRERTAAGFLRGVLAIGPPHQTRYEAYVSNMLTIARILVH